MTMQDASWLSSLGQSRFQLRDGDTFLDIYGEKSHDQAMTPNSGRAIEIFTEALELPIEERVAFLDRVCAGDQVLRRKIASLLRASDRAGAFLEEPLSVSIGEA